MTARKNLNKILCAIFFIAVFQSMIYALSPYHASERRHFKKLSLSLTIKEHSFVVDSLSSIHSSLKNARHHQLKNNLIQFMDHSRIWGLETRIPEILFSFFNSLNKSMKEKFNNALIEVIAKKSIIEMAATPVQRNSSVFQNIDNGPIIINFNPANDFSCDLCQNLTDIKAEMHAGGRGANALRAFDRLGVEAVLYSPTFGINGKIWKKLLEEEGLETSVVTTHFENGEKNTRNNFHYTGNGNELRFDLRGPLIEGEIAKIYEDLFSEKIFRTNGSIILSGTLAPGLNNNIFKVIIKKAKERNIRVFVDASGDALIEASKASPYLLKMNIEEFSQLTGIKTDQLRHNYKKIVTLAKEQIASKGIEILLITLGEDGAIYVDKNNRIMHAIPPSIKVESPVGSGDSFLAGFVSEYLKHENSKEALQFGAAYGTATAAIKGSGVSTIDKIKEILNDVQVSALSFIDSENIDELLVGNFSENNSNSKMAFSSLNKALKKGKQPVFVSDMDETLTSLPGEPVSDAMAVEIINFISKGGLMMLSTGSGLGNVTDWNFKDVSNMGAGVIKQFLFPVYNKMKYLGFDQDEIQALFQHIIFAPKSGGRICHILKINNHEITFSDLFESFSFNDEMMLGKKGAGILEKIISKILGLNRTQSALVDVFNINRLMPLDLKLSWELDLLEVKLLAGDEKDFYGVGRNEWISFLKTYANYSENEIMEIFYEHKDFKDDILNAGHLNMERIIILTRILKTQVIPEWQGVNSQINDIKKWPGFINRNNQIAISLLALKKPPSNLKKIYYGLNKKKSDKRNMRKHFVDVFIDAIQNAHEWALPLPKGVEQISRTQFGSLDGKEYLNHKNLKNLKNIIAKIAGSTSIDISTKDINKRSAIKHLHEISSFLREGKTNRVIEKSFKRNNLNGFFERLPDNMKKKWQKELFVVFSGDTMDTHYGNDAEAALIANIIINVNPFKRISEEFLKIIEKNNPEGILIENDRGYNSSDGFLLHQLFSYLSFFMGDEFFYDMVYKTRMQKNLERAA